MSDLTSVNMFPTITIGPLQLSSYGVIYSVAIVVFGMLVFHRLVKAGYPVPVITRGIVVAILGGIAGAVLWHGLAYLIQAFFLDGELSWRWGAGFMGVVLGGSVTVLVYARRHGYAAGPVLDLAAWPLALGQAIGRLGCFAAGCCYGKAADSWPGMYLRDVGGRWIMRYPTQLISSAADLCIFLVLLTFERWRKRRPDKPEGWPFGGFVFLLYVELYSLKRFSIEFIRGDSLPLLGPFTVNHIICLLVFIVCVVIMLRKLHSRSSDM